MRLLLLLLQKLLGGMLAGGAGLADCCGIEGGLGALLRSLGCNDVGASHRGGPLAGPVRRRGTWQLWLTCRRDA